MKYTTMHERIVLFPSFSGGKKRVPANYPIYIFSRCTSTWQTRFALGTGNIMNLLLLLFAYYLAFAEALPEIPGAFRGMFKGPRE